MRIVDNGIAERKPTGYVMWLSARDTYNWANKPDASWPCSTLADEAIRVEVDSNGLCDGKFPDDCDGNELDAIVADYLPKRLRHLWPVWSV